MEQDGMIKVEAALKEFEKNLKQHMRTIQKKAREEELAKTAALLLRKVIRRNPVKTGRSRAGWYMEKIHEGYIVGNRVLYTKYLEFGHSKQAPHGMLRISLAEIAAKWK